VAGRTFYFKDNQWIDSSVVRDKADQKRERLQFGSEAYFDWLNQHPEATAWLALGRNVVFLLDETVYEIYE
jgi:hypothetical protein